MKNNDLVNQAFVASHLFAIDPGKSNGGIVKFDWERYESLHLAKMSNYQDMVDFFIYQKEICKMPLIFLEKITSYVQDYNDTEMRKRTFRMDKLKEHYAELRAAIKTSQIRYIEVMPHVWQKQLKIHIPKEDREVRKKRYKDISKEWFKGNHVVGWNADAYLIMKFAQMKLKYDPSWVHQQLKKTQITKKTLF